jgi:hypothetical protein
MAPSRNNKILVHEDQALFREAVLFTAGQTGLNANLIEKDYFCTVLLRYLYQQPNSPLIFRGGTCIGKVYADFYRLSEASSSIRRREAKRMWKGIFPKGKPFHHPSTTTAA